MNIFQVFGNTEIIDSKIPISFTFGNFDGVHLGHQSLIVHINKTAPNPVVVMTFNPHPANYFNPNEPKRFLTSLEQKIDLLLKNGVDAVVVQPFTPSFSLLTADDFCHKFLQTNFNIAHIFLGYDLSYGKDRAGDFYHMKEMANTLHWKVHSCPAFENESGNIISSSAIRSALQNGNPHDAERLLSRPYSIEGKVFRGDQRGRQLGYPTVNIQYDPSILIPKFGVYVCEVEFPNKYPDKRFLGVMNCGIRPTVYDTGAKVQIETHILDFHYDVYGEDVIFYLKNFIRKEQKFGSLDRLKEQMALDVSFAKTTEK